MDLSKFQKRKLDPALAKLVTGTDAAQVKPKAAQQQQQTQQKAPEGMAKAASDYLAGSKFQEGRLPLPPLSKQTASSGKYELNRSDLLPEELATLDAVGVTDDVLPADVAKILKEHLEEPITAPVDEKTFQRPAPPPTRDISQLPPEQQEKLKQEIQKSQEIYRIMSQRQTEGKALSDADKERINRIGGQNLFDDIVEDDLSPKLEIKEWPKQQQQQQPQPPQQQPQPQSQPQPQMTVENLQQEVKKEKPPENPFPRPAPFRQAEEQAEASKPPQQSETGVDKATLQYCPHCLWDLKQPDHENPSVDDKLAFLHCLQGLLPFVKTYKLLGDRFEVKFRTLTVGEMQLVQSQAYTDLEKGRIPANEMDFWETVNRYRLYLQLQSIRTEKSYQDFPDGLSAKASPHAREFWQWDDDMLEEKDTGLVVVQQYMLDEVIRTEMFYRIIFQMLQKFNRYVAALEARAYHPDFLSETA